MSDPPLTPSQEAILKKKDDPDAVADETELPPSTDDPPPSEPINADPPEQTDDPPPSELVNADPPEEAEDPLPLPSTTDVVAIPPEQVEPEPLPPSSNDEENPIEDVPLEKEIPRESTTEVIMPPPSEESAPPTSTTEVVAREKETPPQSETEGVVPESENDVPPSSNITVKSEQVIPPPTTETDSKVSASEPAIPPTPSTTNTEDSPSEKEKATIKSTATETVVADSSRIDVGTSTEYEFPPKVHEIGTVTSDTNPHLPGLGNKRDAYTSTSADKINIGTDTAEDDLSEPVKEAENPPSDIEKTEPTDEVENPPSDTVEIIEPTDEEASEVIPPQSTTAVQRSASDGAIPQTPVTVTEPTNSEAPEEPDATDSQQPEATPSKPLELVADGSVLFDDQQWILQHDPAYWPPEFNYPGQRQDVVAGGMNRNVVGDVAQSLPLAPDGSVLFDDQQWMLEHYPAYWPPEFNYPGHAQNIVEISGGQPLLAPISTAQVLFPPGPVPAPSEVGSTLSTSGWPADNYGQSTNPFLVGDNQGLDLDSNYFYCGEDYADDNNYFYCDEQMNANNGCPTEENCNTMGNANVIQDCPAQYTIQDEQNYQPSLGGTDNIGAQEKCTQTFRKATFTESALAFIDTLTSLDSVPCNTCDKPLSERDPCGEEESSWTWMCSILKDIYNDLAKTTKPCVELDGNDGIKEGWTTERASEMKVGSIATVDSKAGGIAVSTVDSKTGSVTIPATGSKAGPIVPIEKAPIKDDSKTKEEMVAVLASKTSKSTFRIIPPLLPREDDFDDPENPPWVLEKINST